MRYQPSKDYKSNDAVMTPFELAEKLVKHFNPSGKGLEPCRGTGNIYRALLAHGSGAADWCEITEGKDFLEYDKRADFVFTNPPWSKLKEFLTQSMRITDNIYFLITINHLWTKARQKLIKANGFYIKEVCLFDTPKGFPQSGFQVGMAHITKGDCDICKTTYL